MGSIFINAGLAAGVALAAVPVILHLFMRQTPKRFVFPALRLIHERQVRSRKKLRIKNWLLLIARMLLLALMALALARPRLYSNTALGDREVPTAMALVFDTSLSMTYRQQDASRLDEAKRRALALLTRSHEASRVYVLDSAEPILPAPLGPASARARVEALAIRPVNRPLNEAVERAHEAIADAEQPRREVYVFTDLARTSWDTGRPLNDADPDPSTATPAAPEVGAASRDTPESEPKKSAPKTPDATEGPAEAATYLVRLGVREPHNAAIVAAAPATGFAAEGQPIPIEVRVRSTGPASTRVVEFLIDGAKRGQQEVALPADGEAVVRFETPKLGPGQHRVEFRLSGAPDPLPVDDRRYLTLNVEPPKRVLVVSDQPIDAEFVAEALDPAALRDSGVRPFPVDRITPAQLAAGPPRAIGDYAAIFLLNIATLPESAWGRLFPYVQQGGGLVVGLGHRVDPKAWNGTAARLLPGTLAELRNPTDPDFSFGRADVAHPLFARNTRDLLAELARVPVDRYREVSPSEDARVLLEYQDGAPALLERVFAGPSAGHVLLWTTALSRRPGNTEAERQANWTEFANPLAGWAFFALMNDTVPYLAGTTGRRLTYEAGEDVALPVDPGSRYSTYTILGPGAETPDRLGEPVRGAGLLITAPPLIGHWTVTATGPDVPPRTLGFSVNVPDAETRLAPLSEAELNALFGGPDGYVLTDDTEEGLKRVQARIRIGHELFPWLMALILVLITAENLLANTFYRDRSAPSELPGPSRRAAA